MTMGDQVVHEDNNQIVAISQLYSGLYANPEIPPQQGINTTPKAKQRRRRKKKGGEGEVGTVGLKKRKLSDEQVSFLEKSFGCEHKLESERKDRLASELGLDPRQVAVWFQNRRARWKNKKLEEEYSKLKSQHDTIFLEKCHLESELLKLRDQLSDAQREIQRLSIFDHTSSNSPSSSMTTTMEVAIPYGDGGSGHTPSFLGADQHPQHCDFGGFDGVFYMPDDSYNSSIIPYMEWAGNYTL